MLFPFATAIFATAASAAPACDHQDRCLWAVKTGGEQGAALGLPHGSLGDWAVFVGADGSGNKSASGNLLALHAKDGRGIWNFTTGGAVTSPPVTYGGGYWDVTIFVFVVSDGHLYAVDPKSGARQWAFPIPRGSGSGASSCPVVQPSSQATVFVAAGSSLYAVNGDDGTLRWSFRDPAGTDGLYNLSPTFDNDRTLYWSSGSHLYALDVFTADKRWSFTTGAPLSSSPVFAGVLRTTVYVGSHDHSVYAVDATTGAKQWSFATGGIVTSGPAMSQDERSVLFGSNDHSLYAVDAATGAKQWSFGTGGMVTASPTVVFSTVYVGSHDGNLYALNTSTGTQLWNFNTSAAVVSRPAMYARGGVLVSSCDGNLYAVDTRTALG